MSCLGQRAQKKDSRGLEASTRSDESQFQILKADSRLRIWRRSHEAMHLKCQSGTVQDHSCSIMVSMFPFGSVRILLPPSRPTIYVVLSFSRKWSISARLLNLSQIPISYCLVDWSFHWHLCYELAPYKPRFKFYWVPLWCFRERCESRPHITCYP